jgi:hypothetical protein
MSAESAGELLLEDGDLLVEAAEHRHRGIHTDAAR